MTARSLPAALLLAAALAGCAGSAPTPAERAEAFELPPDVHSYARPAEARVTHVALDLTAAFERQQLLGTATLTVERADGATELVLDTRDLQVDAVTDGAGNALPFAVGDADPLLGAPLTIQLPDDGDTVAVTYQTSPDAAAVQWLSPEQTTSGQPFLFTQGQAILTRTWIPTQDSPGIRQTYEASIYVPVGLTAVMSADGNGGAGQGADGDRTRFDFALDTAVPPYLIALAVGDLEFREIGPRTGVWAEPSVVAAAADEFADVEEMMDAAEDLYGPYRWGRYDILVLPPSFPFGGMENPRLTFATPTILAGDRSLVSLVAHELAHSWSGNLVTNAVWDDFWLNEGFTSYFENRIMEAVAGRDYADQLRALSRSGLDAELADLDEADTALHLRLSGRDPDDGMTAVAYDKGALFVQAMEEAAGRDRFDAYLRGYFDRFAFQPMTAERFLADMETNLIQGDDSLRLAIDAREWIYGPGLPPNAPAAPTEAFADVDAAAQAFASGGAPPAAWAGWNTHERVRFLNAMPPAVPAARLDDLDAAYGLNDAGNSEIRFAWLRVALRNEYDAAVPSVEAFLSEQGRRKFVLPLYQTLAATDWGRPIAESLYAETRSGYHSVTSNSVDEVLGVPGD